ncbi:TIGR02099 family protein [Kangiella sp. HD9-110m-PIT-SAG07]|nr:TIGR02099 family protein [Kangiella sp. HD9-110m-PIT-SAG07]
MAKTLTRLLRRFATYALWLVSIVVIIFVLFLSVIKLTLPYWTDNKERMTALVENQIGGTFDYQSLEIDWSEFKPSVFIESAQWSNNKKTQSFKANKTYIVLNFWESLFKGYLITETIELNQVDAEIDVSQAQPDNSIFSTDWGLLLKRYPEVIDQESIKVDNLSINLHKNDDSRQVQLSSFNFQKLGKQRQLIIESQSSFASQVRLVIESKGQPFENNNAIKIYGLLRDFDVVDSTRFFELPQGIPVEIADTEFWLEYAGEAPKSGRLLFSAGSASSQVAQLDAEINYQSEGPLSIFSSDQFHVVERSGVDSLNRYDSYFKLVRNEQSPNDINWLLEAENTPIGYFSTLATPFLPVKIREALLQVQPQGELVALDIEAVQTGDGLRPKYGSAEAINLSTEQSSISPKLEVDRITISDEGDGWRLKANASSSLVVWDGVFKEPIPAENFSLDTWVSFVGSPLLNINRLEFINDDVNVIGSGTVRALEDDVDLSLYAEARDINIGELEKYWPRNELKDDVLEFLDMALISGTVELATLTWRGNFEDFPYENKAGQFDIQASVKESQFKFDPDWPMAEGLSASVQFSNNEMFLSADQGSVLGNDIGKVEGVIESLFTEGSVLSLSINNHVAFEPYQALFMNSPLQKWLGEELLDLEFSGQLKNDLQAVIALSDESDDTSITGTVSFAGENIELSSYQLGLNNLKGQLHYTERGAYAEKLKAELWQSPVTIDIAVDEYTNNDDLVNIDANSSFDLAKAVSSLNIQLPIYVEGSSQTNLHYRQDSEGSESLIVRSDLQGTEINGPSWISKERNEESSFLATLYRKSNRIHARTIYRDTVSSQLDFGVDTPGDINGVIALGDLATHSIEVPKKGVAIEGFFGEIHSNEWLNSLQVKKEGEFYWPEWIERISVRTALFTIAGQSLHDVVFTDSLLIDESIRFNVEAREGLGNLTLYNDGRKHVTIEKLDIELDSFSRLSDSEVTINKSSLDNWQLECLSCKINDIDTGKLTLVSNLENGTVVVKGDSQIDGQLSAYVQGVWRGNESKVDIDFTTLDTGSLLKRWGYGDGVKDTKTTGAIKLNWPGGFHDISVATLNGSINLEAGEGSVKELSDRQARVFSLFSLQSVRRRLSLDFSDLFEDGFFYDKMSGEFRIVDGVVHSDNVFIDGTAADVRVKGSIDLVKQTVDQNVTVVPKLGSSLPLLAGWAVEPTTGLIMLLINKIFEPVIDVVVSIEYKVSGNLSNPSVVEVSKKSKEVAVPEVEEVEEITETGVLDDNEKEESPELQTEQEQPLEESEGEN